MIFEGGLSSDHQHQTPQRGPDRGRCRCLGQGLGVVSHLYGFNGEPSDAKTSFALTGNAAIDVFVMQDPVRRRMLQGTPPLPAALLAPQVRRTSCG
jgi:hypothetical protein